VAVFGFIRFGLMVWFGFVWFELSLSFVWLTFRQDGPFSCDNKVEYARSLII
jgi:hypothetical protein